MRQAEVYMHGQVAGHLKQDEQGYTFAYTPGYLAAATAEPVSLTLLLREQPYVEASAVSFFRRADSRRVAAGRGRAQLEAERARPDGAAAGLLPRLHRCREHSSTS